MNDFPAPGRRSEIVAELRASGSVFAEDEADLLLAATTSDSELASLVDRRVAGVPLEVIVGWAEFHGLRVAMDAGVFVPRRRTEFLVDTGIAHAHAGAVVVDLCCGSGALGLAMTVAVPGIQLAAADIDPVAAALARRNLAGVGDVYEGDLFDPLPRRLAGFVDLLLVNAPYVPTAEIARMPPEARIHEPIVALDGGWDGLDVHRRVATQAAGWLTPGGALLIEVSDSQAPEVVSMFRRGGLEPTVEYSEDYDATVVVGMKPKG